MQTTNSGTAGSAARGPGKLPAYCEKCQMPREAEVDAAGVATCSGCGERVSVRYEVFISFSSKQMAQATAVCQKMTAAGLCCWFAPDAIRVGDSFDEQIVLALEQVKVVVLILSADAVRSHWVRKEIRHAAGKGHEILPLRLENFALSKAFHFLIDNDQWVDASARPFEDCVEEIITKAKAAVLRSAAELPAAAAVAVEVPAPAPKRGVDPRNSPYTGPRPFPASMSDKFFGRDAEAKEILRRLGKHRTLLIYAPSGAGKSSLLNTLIKQMLRERDIEVLDSVRFGLSISPGVREEEITNIFSYKAVDCLNETIVADPKSMVADYLRTMPRLPESRGRVLILDQFEEFFTQHAQRFRDRPEFFRDIIAAMKEDPSLRVVFGMRQEFLADIKPLGQLLEGELEMSEFPLRHMDEAGALEAIVKPAEPYADFAPGVAEEIVKQLYVIRVPDEEGKLVEKVGEFFEMVHLQIVCERLWKSLPAGTMVIEMKHLDAAAGEGKTFRDFVGNALNAFLADTIGEIANSPVTREHGGYPKELIQLGCMKFVTASAARTMVQRSHGRTGRLPDWVVSQLEERHLLRSERRGGQQWFELSHDRLAEPIGKQLDRKVTELLFASDLLSKVLERVLAARGALKGYFEEHGDILRECGPFHGQPGLFADEQEFIFRASLTEGAGMREWSRLLREEHPEAHRAVLEDALACDKAVVRANAAWVAGEEANQAFGKALAARAFADDDTEVRTAAVQALAKLDDADLYRELVEAAKGGERSEAALSILATLRIVADHTSEMPVFDGCWAYLPTGLRMTVRRWSWGIRYRAGLPALPYLVLFAMVMAAVPAGLFKWVPGWLGWAYCQDVPSPLAGLFQGLAASVVWAGGIPLALGLYYTVCFSPRQGFGVVRPLGAVVVGAIAGFWTSVLVTLMVVGVYAMDALHKMGWINPPEEARFSPGFLMDLFVNTRAGWVYPITGTALGIGMALYANALRGAPAFQALSAGGERIGNLAQGRALVKTIMGILWKRAWTMPVLMLAGWAVATVVVHTAPNVVRSPAAYPSAALRIFFDCMTQLVGGFFCIVGMGLGLIVMSRGVQVQPRSHRSFALRSAGDDGRRG